MAIYLHPIEETQSDIDQDNWVEIDMVTWRSIDSDYPIGITLLRRLAPNHKEPYLQELMFQGLYRGQPIKTLTLEIPYGPDNNDVDTHTLNDVKVLDYSIYPKHEHNKQSYEKIMLIAQTEKTF